MIKIKKFKVDCTKQNRVVRLKLIVQKKTELEKVKSFFVRSLVFMLFSEIPTYLRPRVPYTSISNDYSEFIKVLTVDPKQQNAHALT